MGINLCPKNIRFTHNSIACKFMCGRTIWETISALETKEMRPRDIPRIDVFWDSHYQAWFSVNNRRLYCFQQANVSTIHANEIDKDDVAKSKITTSNHGVSVTVRGFSLSDPLSYESGFSLSDPLSYGSGVSSSDSSSDSSSESSSDSSSESSSDESDFSSSDGRGCWIFQSRTNKPNWTLRYADKRGEWDTGYDYPIDAKMVRDGVGGVYILRPTSWHFVWELWHVNAQGETNTGYKYPSDSKLVSDGKGGLWVLCDMNKKDDFWGLWHVNLRREKHLYDYHADSKITSDGDGGVWVLCPSGFGNKHDWIWHVTKTRERKRYQYPSDAQMAGDGKGGVWVLCETPGHRPRLWHATKTLQRQYYKYPRGSKIVGDGKGGHPPAHLPTHPPSIHPSTHPSTHPSIQVFGFSTEAKRTSVNFGMPM